jgi:CRP-like cAMP-binding protein
MIVMNRAVSTNQLLKALPFNEYNQLKKYLVPVELNPGQIIYQSGETIRKVYFPEKGSLVSMVTTFNDGWSNGSGLIGCEGAIGAYLALARTTSVREALALTPGRALSIKAEELLFCLQRNKVFNQLIQSYTFAFIEQVAQIGACSNYHSLPERFARLLLMCHDRTGSYQIQLTHEYVSQILGSHRPSITLVAAKLKEQKIIDCRRGMMIILDRPQLEEQTCECYQVVTQIYQSYFSLLENQILSSNDGPKNRLPGIREKIRMPGKVVYT